MNGVGNVFKKEIARIFRDRKMVFSVFILPVLIMLGIMGLVGNLTTNMANDIESHISIIYIQDEPDSFTTFVQENGLNYDIRTILSPQEREEAEKKILDGEADLLIEFPAGFDSTIALYQAGDVVPQIKTYYNPSEDYSAEAYNVISGQTLEAYRQTLLMQRVGSLDQIAIFTINSDNEEMVIQDEEKASGKAIGGMLPYFITILLFAGAMGIGTDMIAGEKERGTMASLLMTPIKRSSIALGKVFSLMSLSGLASIISVAAMVIFMPMFMHEMGGGSDSSATLSLSAAQIVMLGLLLIAIAFLYSTIIALISVFAKTTKEASSFVMPIYLLVLVVGMMTMFQSGTSKSSVFLIPIYNSALVLKNILAREVTPYQYGITLATTVAVSTILIAIIVKAFNSEKIMSA